MVGVVLLFLWLFVAHFLMQDRVTDNYARKIFDRKNVPVTFASQQVQGRKLHYVKTGNDTLPTLFFIHGSPGSWYGFINYLCDQDLLKKYRLISVDRPGLGYSGFGNTCNLSAQSEYISALLTAVDNGKPLYLAGHSLGGALVVKLAADNPELVKGIVILAGSVDPAAEKKERWRPVVSYSPIRWLVPSGMRYSNEELWWLKKDLVKLKNDFPEITCPVYIIHGDKDGLVPVSNADYTKKMLINSPSVRVEILPGAGHFIPWKKFSEVKKILLSLY